MKNIILSNGTTVQVPCLSCALTGGMIVPDGGVILETRHFHAHQDVAYPIAGLVILASKRHVYGLDELTEEESTEYMQLLRRIRQAQRQVLGIAQVYYSRCITSTTKTLPIISTPGWCPGIRGCMPSAGR